MEAASRTGARRWLDWVILATLMAIFILVAIDRLWRLRIAAEQTNLEYMVGTLRSALGIHAAVRVLDEGPDAAAALAGSNPMELLEQQGMRARYAGELEHPDPATIEGRTWYFDTVTRELVYRVAYAEYFLTPLPGPARARFRIDLGYEDLDNNGRFDRGVDIVKGITLRQLDRYRWLEPEE